MPGRLKAIAQWTGALSRRGLGILSRAGQCRHRGNLDINGFYNFLDSGIVALDIGYRGRFKGCLIASDKKTKTIINNRTQDIFRARYTKSIIFRRKAGGEGPYESTELE